jgi:hypothetical protein
MYSSCVPLILTYTYVILKEIMAGHTQGNQLREISFMKLISCNSLEINKEPN